MIRYDNHYTIRTRELLEILVIKILWTQFGLKNFSKEEVQDALNKFLDKINASFDTKKTEHIITIKFKLPVVKDKFQYIDRTNKGKGNSIKKVKRN